MDALIYLSGIFLLAATYYAVRLSYDRIKNKKISGYVLITPFIILFYVLPVLTDYLSGINFDTYSYVYEAMDDPLTTIIYNVYIGSVLIFFTTRSRVAVQKDLDLKLLTDERELNSILVRVYRNYKGILWLVALLPIFLVFFSDDIDFYFQYRGFITNVDTSQIPTIHTLLVKLCQISVLISCFLICMILIEKKYFKKSTYLLVFVFLIVLIDFWLHGKRSIVALFMSCLLMLIFTTKAIPVKKILLVTVFALISFVVFLGAYGKNIKTDQEETYKALRTDFSRDYGVRFAIYNDLIRERYIIPNKFDTFKFNLAFFVPRSYWPAKPQPYAVYFTNSAFGNFAGENLYGWGLTTSIFSESISNLGILGLLFAPFFINFILRKESESFNPFFKLLSIVISILFLVLHPIAFMVLIVIYLVLLVKPKRKFVWKV